MTSVVTVQPHGARAYDVTVGTGVRASVVDAVGSATRVALVYTASTAALARGTADVLAAAGAAVTLVDVPDGESGKTLETAGSCWERLGRAGLTRDDVVVGVGGGAVTDLAGFVASTWLRGIRVVHLPTTVLAMVDAAIGGKTAINTAAGKNLVGAFHHPDAVICDIETLQTLPAAELASGMAEVVKAGFIADPAILELIEHDPGAALDPTGPVLPELIRLAIRVKAEVVSEDPTEQGRREILNYGHTLGHAIERAESYLWRHGEAVSVGMCFAAQLAGAVGRLDQPTIDRHTAILSSIGLPTTYRGDRWEQLGEGMRVDKKNRGSHRRFIVLDGLARPVGLDDPSEESLVAAYRLVSA